ncbi:hypothetical protein [Streptomyces sp. NPDC059460]
MNRQSEITKRAVAARRCGQSSITTTITSTDAGNPTMALVTR